MKKHKHFPSKCIAIDVDKTLFYKGRINQGLVNWLKERKDEGFEIVLWSARGKAYAQNLAKSFEIEELFDSILSKPGYVVDDMGWAWTRYTQVIKNLPNSLTHI